MVFLEKWSDGYDKLNEETRKKIDNVFKLSFLHWGFFGFYPTTKVKMDDIKELKEFVYQEFRDLSLSEKEDNKEIYELYKKAEKLIYQDSFWEKEKAKLYSEYALNDLGEITESEVQVSVATNALVYNIVDGVLRNKSEVDVVWSVLYGKLRNDR